MKDSTDAKIEMAPRTRSKMRSMPSSKGRTTRMRPMYITNVDTVTTVMYIGLVNSDTSTMTRNTSFCVLAGVQECIRASRCASGSVRAWRGCACACAFTLARLCAYVYACLWKVRSDVSFQESVHPLFFLRARACACMPACVCKRIRICVHVCMHTCARCAQSFVSKSPCAHTLFFFAMRTMKCCARKNRNHDCLNPT